MYADFKVAVGDFADGVRIGAGNCGDNLPDYRVLAVYQSPDCFAGTAGGRCGFADCRPADDAPGLNADTIARLEIKHKPRAEFKAGAFYYRRMSKPELYLVMPLIIISPLTICTFWVMNDAVDS